jgi:hypothetical protein
MLIGAQCRIQAAPGLPNLAEVAGRAHGKVALTSCLLLGDDFDQAVLGFRQPAVHPVGHGKIPVGDQ